MLGEGRRVPTAALQSLTSPVTRPPAQLESPATRSSRTDPRHPPAEPRLTEKTLSGVACRLFRLYAGIQPVRPIRLLASPHPFHPLGSCAGWSPCVEGTR